MALGGKVEENKELKREKEKKKGPRRENPRSLYRHGVKVIHHEQAQWSESYSCEQQRSLSRGSFQNSGPFRPAVSRSIAPAEKERAALFFYSIASSLGV